MLLRFALAFAVAMAVSTRSLAQQPAKPLPKDVSQEALYAKITLPWNNSLVRANVPVFGFAGGRNFKAYRLEYGEGREPKAWIPISSGTKPFNEDPWSAGKVKWNPNNGAEGTIGNWFTGFTSYEYADFKENLLGEYTLRLVVEGKDGATTTDQVHVIVAEVLTKLRGGAVRSPDGRFHLSVGPGQVTSSFVLVSMLPSSEPKLDPKLRIIGTPYEFQPPGLEFLKPANLAAFYKDSDLVTKGHGKTTIPPEKLGIYYYEPVSETWHRMKCRSIPETRSVVAEMPGSTKYLAYIALMADTEPPAAPRLAPFGRELAGYSAAFSGEAEPECEVDILLDGKSIARCLADDAGKFITARLRLSLGRHQISAKATDPAANESVSSEEVLFSVAPTPPKTVKSVRWLGNTEARFGDQLRVELVGEDASDRVDHALVKVSSESDPSGFDLELTETGPKTGIYVGLVSVGDVSSVDTATIQAVRNREKITATSSSDLSKRAEVSFVDNIPPSTPHIECASCPLFALSTFEEGSEKDAVAGWRTVEGRLGAAISLDENNGNRFLKLTRQQWQSHMGAVALERAYETRDWPLVAFDCLIPQGMKIDLLASVKDLGVFTIRLTGEESAYYPQIGMATGIRTDGQWSHVTVNLHAMLSRRFPGRTSFQVERLQFGSWVSRGFLRQEYGASGAAGVWVGIDNFAVLRPAVGEYFQFTWTSQDPSGVVGYSYVIDRTLDTVPPARVIAGPVAVVRAAESGCTYLHVAAVDTCGNWSRAAHYPILRDSTPPTVGSLKVVEGGEALEIPLTDTGAGIDPGSIVIDVGGKRYDGQSRAISYDAKKGLVTLRWAGEQPAFIAADGEQLHVSITAADVVGNKAENLQVGTYSAKSPLKVSPPNPDGKNGFYLSPPKLSYEGRPGEKALLTWQVDFEEDALSRKGRSLNTLRLTVRDAKGEERSFVKEMKLDSTVPTTKACIIRGSEESPLDGGTLAKGAIIALRHDDYALSIGGFLSECYSDSGFNRCIASSVVPGLSLENWRMPPDAKVRAVTWSGSVRAEVGGPHGFKVRGIDPFAELQVSIDGEVVGKKDADQVKEDLATSVFVTKGWHRFEVRYAPKNPVEAGLALAWTTPTKSEYESIPVTSMASLRSLATTYYRVDGGPWNVYSRPIAQPLPGAHTLSFYSEDLAGHEEAPTTVDLKIP